VECVNSVVRMQQARHRVMTQGLLDLEAGCTGTFINFEEDAARIKRQYGLVGVRLPESSFWEFLEFTPEELRERLSAKGCGVRWCPPSLDPSPAASRCPT